MFGRSADSSLITKEVNKGCKPVRQKRHLWVGHLSRPINWLFKGCSNKTLQTRKIYTQVLQGGHQYSEKLGSAIVNSERFWKPPYRQYSVLNLWHVLCFLQRVVFFFCDGTHWYSLSTGSFFRSLPSPEGRIGRNGYNLTHEYWHFFKKQKKKKALVFFDRILFCFELKPQETKPICWSSHWGGGLSFQYKLS